MLEFPILKVFKRNRGGRVLPVALFFLLLFLTFVPVHAGGQAGQESAGQSQPVVYASVPPQADIIRRIAGDFLDARSIIQPGQDAHTFDPSPREVQRLASARAIFRTGLEFEDAILTSLQRTSRNLQVVDLRQGITMRQLEAHWHDPSVPHAHAEGNPDPHIWLGPREVAVQAGTIRSALLELFPEHRSSIEQGYAGFMDELSRITNQLDELLGGLSGKAVLVYHPAFGYLTDTYGIQQLAIEAGGREPSPRLLQQTIEKALAAGVQIIFTQPEYEQTAARAVARAIGAEIVVVTDLDENWSDLMLSIGQALSLIGID